MIAVTPHHAARFLRTRRRERWILLALGLLVLSGATALLLYGLRENVSYFKTPSELLQENASADTRYRLGGLVRYHGSADHGEDTSITFRVYDDATEITVVYRGILPDLFRNGQGVVVDGTLGPNGEFLAETVLARHDENYMPAELAKSLRNEGVWRGPETRNETAAGAANLP